MGRRTGWLRTGVRTRWLPLCLSAAAMIAWAWEGQGQEGRAIAVQGQRAGAAIHTGKDLMEELYCIACHTLPFEKEGEVPPRPAPDLTFQGDKVRPEWLFDFLRRPHPLRPWLKARMPSFWLSDEEALALTEYLLTLKHEAAPPLPEKFTAIRQPAPEDLKAAQALVSKDYFDCLTCHQQGEQKPEGPAEGWAPDLSLAPQRLNPDWIIRWLKDPQEIQPGTKMPTYFPGGPADVLGGDDDRQIIGVRDFLMSLGKQLDPTEFGQARAKYPKATPELGRRLAEEMNCVGCHRMADLPMPGLKIGPDLTRRHNPVTKEWLVTFLNGPEKIRRPGYLGGARRMPNFRLSDEEVEAIAAYLMATIYPRVEVPASKPTPAAAENARATGTATVR